MLQELGKRGDNVNEKLMQAMYRKPKILKNVIS